MEFPEIRGRSLAGEDVLIPTGLPGEVHVLILAFRQGQQADVDRWIAALAAEGVTGIYELPMLGARWQAFRRVIDGGMATSIRTPEVLARTITVYGQIGPVEKSLALPTRGEVHTVVESAGQVLYIAHGPPRDPADVERVVRAARSAQGLPVSGARRLDGGMGTATPFIWLQGPVEEAARFYTGTFGGDVLEIDIGPAMQSATIRILGQTIHLFNAGPFRPLTEAFSLMVTCGSQEEIDRYWDALSQDGTPTACGWVTDRFGVTWQVIPEDLRAWLQDPERGAQVQQVMLQMVKIEIAPLRAALHAD